jgi:hypothetical protein
MDIQTDAFHRAIGVLEQLGDQELLDAYKAYVARLEQLLGKGWLDTYTSMYQRDRRQLTGQAAGSAVLPEEIAVRDRVAEDPELARLYQRYIDLLHSKKLLDEKYIG